MDVFFNRIVKFRRLLKFELLINAFSILSFEAKWVIIYFFSFKWASFTSSKLRKPLVGLIRDKAVSLTKRITCSRWSERTWPELVQCLIIDLAISGAFFILKRMIKPRILVLMLIKLLIAEWIVFSPWLLFIHLC